MKHNTKQLHGNEAPLLIPERTLAEDFEWIQSPMKLCMQFLPFFPLKADLQHTAHSSSFACAASPFLGAML